MNGPLRVGQHPQPTGRAYTLQAPDELGGYVERLIKLIPAEAVGLYLFGAGIIPNKYFPTAFTIWAGVCLLVVIAFRALATADSSQGQGPQWAAIAIAAVSFIIWLFSLGAPPFADLHKDWAWVGSLVIALWTTLIPLVYKG